MFDTKGKGQRIRSYKPCSLAFDSAAGWQSGLMPRTVNPVNGVESTCSVRPNRTPAVSLKTALLVVGTTSGAHPQAEAKRRGLDTRCHSGPSA